MLTKREKTQHRLLLTIKKLTIKRDKLRQEIKFLAAALQAGNNEMKKKEKKSDPEKVLSIFSEEK